MRNVLVVMLLTAGACVSALAVNVRGRADYVSPSGRYPMNGALVEICFAPTNQCRAYKTGYDGMYYFNTGTGQHYVRINGVVRTQLVIPNAPSFDVVPLRGN